MIAGLDALHEAMAGRVERGEFPGMVILVGRDDDVHVDAIGTKAFDSSERMRRETLFRIASMTKPILAVATLQLVQDGTFSLSDPIEKWLPEMANPRVLRRIDGPLDETEPAQRSITIEDLLTFRMGHGHYFDPSTGTLDPPIPIVERAKQLELVLGAPDPRTPHPPDKWMELYASLPLMTQPGEHWQYNTASLLLGVLLARASDMDLGDLFGTRIFEPLGMHDTGFWLPLERTRDLPLYYMSPSDPRPDLSPPELWSKPPVFPSGAGGLLSTVDDYLKFARMLLDGGRPLLSAESVRLMTTNHLTAEQRSTGDPILGGNGWGYGVAVVTGPSAEWPTPGRYGWSGGYGTTWFNDPHRRIVAIAMTQVSEFMWSGVIEEFNRLVAAL